MIGGVLLQSLAQVFIMWFSLKDLLYCIEYLQGQATLKTSHVQYQHVSFCLRLQGPGKLWFDICGNLILQCVARAFVVRSTTLVRTTIQHWIPPDLGNPETTVSVLATSQVLSICC